MLQVDPMSPMLFDIVTADKYSEELPTQSHNHVGDMPIGSRSKLELESW